VSASFVTELLKNEEVRRTAISAEEGVLLQKLIAEKCSKVTVEVGLGHGVSALFICEALVKAGGRRHIAIDPNSSGIRNLEEAGFGSLVDFRQQKSHVALPELVAEGVRVDFALIDGFHTFDHVLLDFFYVDMLLNVGGVVVFDDAEWPAIHRVCRFIATNRAYRAYAETGGRPVGRASRMISWCARRSRVLGRLLQPRFSETDESLGFSPHGASLIAFEKLADDNRRWDFDRAF